MEWEGRSRVFQEGSYLGYPGLSKRDSSWVGATWFLIVGLIVAVSCTWKYVYPRWYFEIHALAIKSLMTGTYTTQD